MSWGMAWPYLPNYIRLLGGTMLFVAMLSVLFNLTSSLGQYLWGRFSDSSGRRKPFVLLGLCSSAVFFLLIGMAGSATVVLLLRAFQGFFVSSQTPAVSALVSELSENVGRGFGVFNLFSNIGFMLGNFAGGIIVSVFPVNYVFFFSTIPVLISFVMISLFREEVKKAKDFRPLFRYDRPGRTVFSWRRATEFFHRNRNIVIFTVSTFILMLSSGMVYSYLSLLLERRFGEDFVGYYYGLDGLAASFLIYPFGYLADRFGSKIVILFGSLLYVLTFYLYSIASTVPAIVVTAMISGTKWASYFNSINTYVARMSTREERATALGFMNSGIAMGWVVGPLIGAFIVSRAGLEGLMLLSTIPVVVSMAILAFVKNDRGYVDGKKVN